MRINISLLIGGFMVLCILSNCNKEKSVGEPPVAVTDTTYWIVASNQASNRIEVYDPKVTDWNSNAALKWSWYPNSSNGFSDPIPGWRLPTDAKLRNSNTFGCQVMVVAAYGFSAIISYPAGEKRWAQAISGNLHSSELLPNGNIAIAASEENWIRVYASSQGANSSTYAQYNLNSAHGVLWDPEKEILWVLGQDQATNVHILTALKTGGTPSQPDLTEVMSYRSTLPTAWGHDLSPVYGDKGKLWISTNSGVYIYNKKTKTFTSAPSASNRKAVKTISNQPSGQIVETQPDFNKNPKPVISSSANDWSTSTVDFYSATGSLEMARSVNGACFYKARVWCSDYQ